MRPNGVKDTTHSDIPQSEASVSSTVLAIKSSELRIYVEQLDRRFEEYRASFKEYVLSEFKRIWDRFEALQLAVNKAEKASDQRMEEANGLRKQLDKTQQESVREPDYRANQLRQEDRAKIDNERLDMRIKDLERNRSNLEGRLWGIGAVLFIVQIVLGLAMAYFLHK